MGGYGSYSRKTLPDGVRVSHPAPGCLDLSFPSTFSKLRDGDALVVTYLLTWYPKNIGGMTTQVFLDSERKH